MGDEPASYPGHRATDVVLRDGSTVHVRPIRPDDEERLLAFLRSLSEASRVFRFFSPTKDPALIDMAHRETRIDYRHRFALVATTGPGNRIVGHALFAAMGDADAEVAFAVADDYQGRGLGTILLGHLAEIAASQGIQQFAAFVMQGNTAMLGVFRESGFPVDVKFESGEFTVAFPTSLTEEALARFDRREQIAATGALATFFRPRGVAVVGASRRRGTIGGEVFHNLLSYEFAGPVYPVNPAAAVVQSVLAYPTIEAVPGPVDLAIVAVPAADVVEIAEQCARKGVRALVVISAGFAELGVEGQARQEELLRVCRASGMRLIGPNCMGITNTDPAVRLNATFAPHTPPAGRVGFSSQSGALGLAIIDYANSLGLGVSTFVSVGNKADISGNDLINYWETDPQTDLILLYLESFGNPRKFSRIARRVGRAKPIVVVKSGRSPAGTRATSSHTGALLAASDVTVDALFRQAGVIRTDTLEELFDVASLLAHQPPPTGRRVGIITNGGGPGILCADACEAEGMEIPLLTDTTQARLRAALAAQAAVGNPVDMIASATAEQYRQAIQIAAEDPNVDALIVIFVPPLVTRPEDVAAAIVEGARAAGGGKPILTVFMSTRGVPETLKAADVRIPSYAFPESAAIALARVARHGEWRTRPPEPPPRFEGLKRTEAFAIVTRALGRDDRWLTPEETHALLSCYGLPVAAQRAVLTPDEVGRAAGDLGEEVALKAIHPKILHKTDAGAVRLHLRGAEAARAAAKEMADRLAASGTPPAGFLVQAMAPKGVEMIVGVVHDPQFGPIVACGAGGILVELLRDVSIRLTPLSPRDASEMIRDLATYPLLTGFRGQPKAKIAALEDVLLRVGVMVEDLPQIAELDCNPIIVHPLGAVVVDARIRVAPVEPPSVLARRWVEAPSVLSPEGPRADRHA
jgi:acetyl coenzyme A synthetase (ADP forming)-like protein